MLGVLGAGAAVYSIMGDEAQDALLSMLLSIVYRLLYYISCGLLKIVSVFDSMFEVMAGLSKVIYNGEGAYLIDVFFSNTAVSKVYWGMALIGIAMAFAFAIIAVIRKKFDINEREKRSHGAILGSLFKSILIILCMSFLVTAVINATNVLMQQINYVFANVEDIGKDESITYTDEELAAMARVLNTIGNYSMNPSYDSRYNINSCFNELRPDMQYLAQQGVFDFYYTTTDVNGNTVNTWQSVLQKIANSASLNRDLKMDVYYESVSLALLEAMDILRSDGSLKPLQSYERQYTPSRQVVPLDRVLFLMVTMTAAKNEDYNVNGSMTDNLRGPYYYGEKSIYNLSQVNADFNIGLGVMDYVILFLAAWKLIKSLLTIILNCVARIFNSMVLYLIAPPVVAAMPLDDGGKFKQWLTAFIVQSFSVFGTVVAMRVLLLFLPVIVDSNLQIFDNPVANMLAKLVIILGAFEVAEKATNLITGILADNAGWQSIAAGDMSQTAGGAINSTLDFGAKYGVKAGKFGLSSAITTGKYGLMGAGIVGAGAALGAGYAAYGVARGAGWVAGKAYDGGSALAGKISNAWANRGKRGTSDAGGTPGSTGSLLSNSSSMNSTESLLLKNDDPLPSKQDAPPLGQPPAGSIPPGPPLKQVPPTQPGVPGQPPAQPGVPRQPGQPPASSIPQAPAFTGARFNEDGNVINPEAIPKPTLKKVPTTVQNHLPNKNT